MTIASQSSEFQHRESQPSHHWAHGFLRLARFSVGGLLLLEGVIFVMLWPSLAGLLAAMFSMHKTDVVLEAASSDEGDRLVVEARMPLTYSDPAHRIQVYQASEQGRHRQLLSTSLYNDGIPLLAENVSLTWQNDEQALLRLEGEKQASACHLLTLGKAAMAEDVPCSVTEDGAGDKPELIPESPIVLGSKGDR